MNIAEVLREDILRDEYFLQLFNKLESVNANSFFSIDIEEKITEKEYNDLMRFADILSHSIDPDARNLSYKIVSLLVEDFINTESFYLYANAIFAKLGNFPALKFLKDKFNKTEVLPLERRIEKHFKETTQKTSNGKNTFTDAQYEIREKLEKFNYFSFSGPTSIGKSFILKDYVYSILNKDLAEIKIVLLVPTRALIDQVISDLRSEIDNEQINIASHPILSKYASNKYKKHIFIFTPERLLSYLSHNNLGINYLFIDESQKIIAPNDTRSSLYYHAIYEATKKFNIKIVFASPNIPNPNIFLELFDITNRNQVGTLFDNKKTEAFAVSEQTVAQNRYFIDYIKKEVFYFSDLNEKKIDLKFPEYLTSSSEMLKEIGKNSKNLVYHNAVYKTVEGAKEFAKKLKPISISEDLKDIIDFITKYVHKDYYLIECLKKGVAFHHGRIPQKVRRKIEFFFINGNSSLKYIFCTSTLLEGVNLPAKNIFIFTDKHGRHKFEKIDFENLIGRAGRLTKEFSGNVLCIKDEEKTWSNINVIKKTKLQKIESFLLNTETRKKGELLNLGKAIQDKNLSTRLKVGEKANIIHYASIILLHEIEEENSVLKRVFCNKIKDASKILQTKKEMNKVPSEIIRASSTIKPKYQNKVLEYIEDNKKKAILNLSTPDMILKSLEILYDLYEWENEESTGKDSLIPSAFVKGGYGKHRLTYWGMLLNAWVNSEPLNKMIYSSINYHKAKKYIWFYGERGLTKENFIENQQQINIIIEQIMNDIENGIRFKIKKYFLNYCLLLKHVLGEDVGQDLSEFIEYGTVNRKVIELQNLGLSRGASNYLLKEYTNLFHFDHNENLLTIKEVKLSEDLDKNNEHYKEIKEILKLKNNY